MAPLPSLLVLASLAILACVIPTSEAQVLVTSAAVTVSALTTTITSTTLTATATDESVLLVEESGVAYATSVTFIKTGDTTSTDDSAFSDLNAAIAIQEDGVAYLYSCTVTTDGEGANILHTYEDGSEAYVYDLSFTATGEFSHGIYTAGGYIYAENLSGSTAGTSSSAIATDSGGGTIVVISAEVYTYGLKSALVYSTGNITVASLSGSSSQSPACVIDGANSWTLTDPSISAAPAEHGVFQFFSSGTGNTDLAYGYITGGSVSETGGDYGLVFIGNIEGNLYLADVTVSISSGILANVSADSSWGTSGANGGTGTIVLSATDVSGDVYVDDISTLVLELTDESTFEGTVNAADTASSVTIILDSESTWTVTGTSYVSVLTDADTTYSNIVSDGYTVYYDSTLSTALDGATIWLSGGGSLTPV